MTGLLKATYGSLRLNDKDDPLDELFVILLSEMTTGPSYYRVDDPRKQRCRTGRRCSQSTLAL